MVILVKFAHRCISEKKPDIVSSQHLCTDELLINNKNNLSPLQVRMNLPPIICHQNLTSSE